MKTTKSPNSHAPKLSQTGLLLGLLALVPTALSPAVLLPMPAIAQISSDGSLSTSVTTNGNSFTINGGDRAGGNLFHSFSEFSVPTGGEAFFNNDLDVENIFSRVTGGNISNIDGLIRANGSANLFLLNPAGIVFGPNARLDIGGSFLGSSASSLMWADGTEFSATDTQSTPLLTINAPIGLWFRGNEGNIVNQSAVNDVGLQVQLGRSLGLVGGNVSLDGGLITAPGGRVELGGLAALGTVGLNADGSLSFPDRVARGDVSFANAAFVDVRAGGGGSIAVNARDMEMLGGSRLWAGIGEDMGTAGSNAGDVTLNATESIIVSQSSNIQNRVFNTGSTGNSGDINVKAGSLLLSDGGSFSASTLGRGDGGNINVDVSGPVNLTGMADDGSVSRFASVVTEGAVGNGGEIKINAGAVSLSNGALLNTQVFGADNGLPAGQGNAGDIRISTGSFSLKGESTIVRSSTVGQGNAGNVTIEADGNVSLEGGDIFSNVDTGVVGDSGNIEIRAGVLSLIDGAQVQTSVNGISESNPELPGGRGNAGQIMIDVSGAVEIMGKDTEGFPSAIFSTLGEGAVGSAGSVEISARSLEVSNGAILSTDTLGEGDAGSVRISADGEVRLSDESIISSSVAAGGVGQGGNIEISARSLEVSNGAALSTDTFGEGDGGSITISADGEVRLSDEGRITSSVGAGGVGTGGNIEIAGGAVEVSSAVLFTSTSGEGDGGSITISSDGEVRLSDGIFISSSVGEGGVGTGGNIEIAGGSVEVSNGTVSTSTFGEGDGGSVRISADGEVRLSDVFISSSVGEGVVGTGGNIEIAGRSVEVSNGAVFASTFGEGDAGNVRISSDGEVRLSDGIFISSSVGEGGVGTGGNIEIAGGSVEVSNGTVSTSTFGEGDGGSVRISADGEVRLSDEIFIFSAVGAGVVGTGGEIEIAGRSVEVVNGARLSSNTFGEGDAGSVRISADEAVRLSDESRISSGVGEGGVGTGGQIEITGRSLSASNGAELSTSTSGEGDAGIVSIKATDAVELSGTGTEISSNVNANGNGNAGGIIIETGSLSVTEGVILTASTLGKGDAGSVVISANGEVMLEGEGGGIISVVSPEAVGNGGSIEINARSLSLNNGALVSTSTSGEGDAGNVSIDASGEVRLEGGLITSDLGEEAVGTGGSIDITARSLSLNNGAALSTSTVGEGDAGEVRVNASEEVTLEDGFILSLVGIGAVGNGGGIDITARSLSLSDGAQLSTSTLGKGNAGNVRIDASGEVRLEVGFITSGLGEEAIGQGGSIDITARSLSLRNSALVSTSTSGEGDAGNVSIDASGEVRLEGGLITSDLGEGAVGTGGSIDITARSLSLNNGAALSTSTVGEGDAGEVRVNASEEVTLEDGFILSLVGIGAVGNGGGIDITARSLSLTNGARLSAETLGEGSAGSVRVEASEAVRLEEGFILSFVGTEAVGAGGSIDIVARSVSLTDGSELITQTDSTGRAGDIKIDATDSITISGVAPIQEDESGMVTGGSSSGLLASTEENATGSGGTIEVTTGTLRLLDGGVLSARSRSSGEGGNVIVNVEDLELTGGGQIVTTAFSTGAAGSITVNATGGRVTASGSDRTFPERFAQRDEAFNNGLTEVPAELAIDQVDPASGLFAQSRSTDGTGSGDITVVAESLALADGAEVTLSSAGTGSAGNLIVNASEISLNNGTLDARTASGNQGNITLNASENIQLRNSSAINTNAEGTATGGNIFIDTDFLIAFPGNSDITANAIQGDGGRIEITAEGILGIAQRGELTPENDITVTSTFGSSGEVIFNLPDVDALRGIEELSDNAIDPDEAVAQACRPDSEENSSFTVIGRGGLPRGPQDPLVSDTMGVGGTLSSQRAPNQPPIVTLVEDTEPISSEDIVLARGWIVNEDGVVELTAYPTPYTSDRPFPTPVRCPGNK